MMGGTSKIEWTERTWNPIVGCSIISPGCTNCYAMRMAARIEAMGNQPRYAGTTKKVNGNAIWTGKLAMAPDSASLAPLRRKKPTTYFVNSMGDLFHEDCPDEWIDRVFAVMALAPQHTFQVLTKRAKRMREYFDPRGPGAAKRISRIAPNALINLPLPNVWLGVSTERQQEADERIPLLLETPAAVRFISAEPLLGPIILHPLSCGTNALDSSTGPNLDWVIVGGESGSGARPMHPKWAKDIRDQCATADVAFFFKQFGSWAPHQFASNNSLKGEVCVWQNGRTGTGIGGANEHGPGAEMDNVGKKRAGRLLDGVEHNGMPG